MAPAAARDSTSTKDLPRVNEHILVVDDEAIVTEVVERYLIRDGYQVTVVRDGNETAYYPPLVGGVRATPAGVEYMKMIDAVLAGRSGS